MVRENEALEKVLSKLTEISNRLDSMEDQISDQSSRIDEINSGVVSKFVKFSTSDVNKACGVIAVSEDRLLGEGSAHKKGSAAEEKKRKERQVLGGHLFSVYVLTWVALMGLSFQGMIPVADWETMKFDKAVLVSEWLRNHMHLPFVFSFGYVTVVFGVQHLMKDRKPFHLRYPLALWSFALCIFSLAGSLRTVPKLLEIIYEKGLFHLVCMDTRNDWVINHPAGVWTMFFIHSKVPELIDTLFIVLRKNKLITLHWYHHITVMIFCWHSWSTYCLNGLVYSAMNLTVHAFMYFFYTLAALGYRPTSYAMTITVIQILQMVVGTAVTVYVNYHMQFVEYQPLILSFDTNWDVQNSTVNTDTSCKVHRFNALAGLVMYASYLWLFCMFFYLAYLQPAKKTKVA